MHWILFLGNSNIEKKSFFLELMEQTYKIVDTVDFTVCMLLKTWFHYKFQIPTSSKWKGGVIKK